MIILRQTSFNNHRQQHQQLIRGSQGSSSRKTAGTKLGEVVGGATAVCCCFPVGLANVMFLAIYKVPASLCKQALQKRKQRRRLRQAKKEGLYPPNRCYTYAFDEEFGAKFYGVGEEDLVKKFNDERLEEERVDKEVVELEKEMWETFYGTGFWRSCSKRENNSSSQSFISIVSGPNVQNHDAKSCTEFI
ncbi:hypothetical protein PIB30_011916 [Stylosanthes scabra]|uniref:Transmembrane protein n=1 Tax=Stylosanthes scabra TaxID=79078 RepID=A0ABU6V8B7_9FABA|nr:hypothetical protein [Stylosanthes scabra]